jgi:hypothetical protein
MIWQKFSFFEFLFFVEIWEFSFSFQIKKKKILHFKTYSEIFSCSILSDYQKLLKYGYGEGLTWEQTKVFEL